MISRPHPRELTQGTIFTCALTENYLECDSYGLIITARCDVANSKTPIFSYIPVVPYRQWMARDGAAIIASRAVANATGEIKRSIKSAGLVESIFDTLSEKAIVDLIAQDTTKAGKLRLQKVQENFSTIEKLQNFLLKIEKKSSQAVIDDSPGLYKGLVKDLLGNTLSDFHYLEEIEFDGQSDGYVASLREIRLMPSSVASRILNGLTMSEFLQLGSFGLHFKSEDDYSMPVGLLKSPYIEFLMQRVTNLFARIGVTDASQDRISMLNVMYEASAKVNS